ncbi:MAG: aldehyde dehydrogenase family protein [Rhodobacteraceae bacterium]|nr:aldehyde dehydrogenase family protein [Paracoccaceae bacterium]
MEQQNLIDGRWRPAGDGGLLQVRCPSDGLAFTRIPESTNEDVDAAVRAARKAYESGAWSRLTATDRGRLLLRLAELTDCNRERLTTIEARDTGKPMRQARADIEATVRYFEFYGGAADKLHGEVIPFSDGYHVQAVREAFGVTAHITPWNYPAQMFGRTLAPALAAGNAVVLKPAEDACLAPLALAGLALEAGFPAGAVNIVCGTGEAAGRHLAAHPGVDFLSFTGSPEVGASVQAAAGRNHVGCTLELGGKSPQIVFADADLDTVVPVVVNAIVQNSGQTCSAGSRALIQRSVFDRVMAMLSSRFASLTAAPHHEDRDLGALISAAQLKRVEAFFEQADTAPLCRGDVSGSAPEGGHYFAPALFGPVSPEARIAREEVFGPVLCCIPFDEEADAVRLANATEYGLVAGVWTNDGSRQVRMSRALRCGQVFINCFGAGGGIELPFGGVGKSGHGREKGFEALRGFTQTKTIIQKFG